MLQADPPQLVEHRRRLAERHEIDGYCRRVADVDAVDQRLPIGEREAPGEDQLKAAGVLEQALQAQEIAAVATVEILAENRRRRARTRRCQQSAG